MQAGFLASRPIGSFLGEDLQKVLNLLVTLQVFYDMSFVE